MKKFKLTLLLCIFTLFNTFSVFATTDSKIFVDKIENSYIGTENIKPLINNLKFSDLPSGYWANEAIIRAGALNIVKGYNSLYRPNDYVSNQEALAFVIRVMGLENEAQKLGDNLKTTLKDTNNPLPIWSLGYLALANNNGLITNAQYADSMSVNQNSLTGNVFDKTAPASREQTISWLITGINKLLKAPLSPNEQQSIYNYKDWQNLDTSHIDNMEIALDNNIIKGNDKNMLNPKGTITRAEIAQIISNLGDIYNSMVGLSEKYGTIGGIKDAQITQTGKAELERKIYVRTEDGKVDTLSYTMESSHNPKNINKDAVVFNNGANSLSSLREGMEISYLVDNVKKTIKFVSVKNNKINEKEINGKLKNINFDKNTIQITNNIGKTFTYPAIQGIIGKDSNGGFIYMNNKKIKKDKIPIGAMINMISKNNIIHKITFKGGLNLENELRGVVIENNAEFGYITVLDNNANEVTKSYFSDDIIVEKQPYFSGNDDIGYLDQMFPNFKYDPRDTTINNIEAGDIVFITSKKDEPSYIDKISASPNYFMKQGKVIQILNNIDNISMTLKFDNGQTQAYNFKDNVFVSKGGSPVSANSIVDGDFVKILVNEAILSPGETIESIKEITIDEGNKIGTLIKGEIGKIDTIQKTISLNNSYKLGQAGWEDYKQIRDLNIENDDIEYYYNAKKVSLDFVKNKLKRANGSAYVALESTFSGDIIKKITFRNGRDEMLSPDIIVTTNGIDTFATPSSGLIKADAGTIIRKNGRLISPQNIDINDYAIISLNGGPTAGIIDIYDMPVTDSLSIARIRIKDIEDNKYFITKSMSVLNGNEWQYSPIERKFNISEKTLYVVKDEIKNINEFIGYGENTSIDKAFTIIYNGDMATHIIDGVYPTKIVFGTVYEAGNNIKLRRAKYIDDNNMLKDTSIKNATINLATKKNTIVIKNNTISSIDKIQKNDKLKVLTHTLPEEIGSNMDIDASIIFVENSF